LIGRRQRFLALLILVGLTQRPLTRRPASENVRGDALSDDSTDTHTGVGVGVGVDTVNVRVVVAAAPPLQYAVAR
jgi:hypothetical protein